MTDEEIYKEHFLSLLGQACGKWNPLNGWVEYDSLCLSSYHDALEFAVQKGWISRAQVTR